MHQLAECVAQGVAVFAQVLRGIAASIARLMERNGNHHLTPRTAAASRSQDTEGPSDNWLR